MANLGFTRGQTLKRIWQDGFLPLLFYTGLSLALSWPLARDFASKTLGQSDDVRHSMWILWHYKEALLGQQPLFQAPMLYYPAGISTLVDGVGLVPSLFALPFWLWGPAAAYNGALLISLILTGYSMYLLGRGLRFSPAVALFAGTVLAVSSLNLASLYGHLEKVFIGLLPLALLSLIMALDVKRSRWWVTAVPVILLLTLLHNGLQFVLAGMGLAVMAGVIWLTAVKETRPEIIRRLLLIGGLSLVIVGPMLFVIAGVSRDPRLRVDLNIGSLDFQPDVAEFFWPPPFSRLFAGLTYRFINRYGYVSNIETWVYMSWMALLLALVALRYQTRRVWPWLIMLAGSALLALGPSLQLLGQRHFTEYHLPIILPYAFFTALPGLDFLRTPGRIIFLGHVALAVAAAYGLEWLGERFSRWRHALVVGAIMGVLLPVWPAVWPQGTQPPLSPFYQQMAADDEMYGVFDLPIKRSAEEWYVPYSSRYQMAQMVHRKGIANGYLSRAYLVHPVFPCLMPEMEPPPDVLVNGRLSPCYANPLYDLAAHNYRYVIWHKSTDDRQDDWGQEQAQSFINQFFPEQRPLYADEWITVYEVPELQTLPLVTATMVLGQNWYEREPELRWAKSPASLLLTVPQAQEVVLEITPALIFNPTLALTDEQRQLLVTVDDQPVMTVPITSGETAVIPLHLPAGYHTITLSLAAGNFRPSDQGAADTRWLSFAIESINLLISPPDTEPTNHRLP
ncbi:MAG: hypothetical protein KJ069_08810 [Anaerolineae bacterium]|nr:hypothetical protein [Anaerolineae bacterium]